MIKENQKHTKKLDDGDCSTASCSPVLLVSVSGGRSSALMARMIQVSTLYDNYEKVYVYANTGKEKQETLDFIHEMDKRWGLGVVWIESVSHKEKGKGSTHRIIDYSSAIVNTDEMKEGHPFFDMVQNYGVPNNNFLHCTRELKSNPIRSYMRSGGHKKGSYKEAWGYRFDEPKRLRPRKNIIYPLAELKITEQVVREFWDKQDFDLGISQFQGNCDLCFKKSLKKRVTIIKDNPEIAEDWGAMERIRDRKGNPLTFDRDGLTINDLITLSKSPELKKAVDSHDKTLVEPELYEATSMIDWDFEKHCHCS